jgi:hypothetical protein
MNHNLLIQTMLMTHTRTLGQQKAPLVPQSFLEI